MNNEAGYTQILNYIHGLGDGSKIMILNPGMVVTKRRFWMGCTDTICREFDRYRLTVYHADLIAGKSWPVAGFRERLGMG